MNEDGGEGFFSSQQLPLVTCSLHGYHEIIFFFFFFFCPYGLPHLQGLGYIIFFLATYQYYLDSVLSSVTFFLVGN